MKPIIKLILIVIPICVLFAAFIYGIWAQYMQPFLTLSTNYLTNVNNFIIVVSVILSLIALITVLSILRGSVSRRNEYKTMPIRQRLQYKQSHFGYHHLNDSEQFFPVRRSVKCRNETILHSVGFDVFHGALFLTAYPAASMRIKQVKQPSMLIYSIDDLLHIK